MQNVVNRVARRRQTVEPEVSQRRRGRRAAGIIRLDIASSSAAAAGRRCAPVVHHRHSHVRNSRTTTTVPVQLNRLDRLDEVTHYGLRHYRRPVATRWRTGCQIIKKCNATDLIVAVAHVRPRHPLSLFHQVWNYDFLFSSQGVDDYV